MAQWSRQSWGGVLLFVLFLLCTTPGFAQQPTLDLQQELDNLKKGQQAIQRELQEIKKLLQQAGQRRRPAAPNVSGMVFDLGNNPVKGEPAAMLTLIEFTDYQ